MSEVVVVEVEEDSETGTDEVTTRDKITRFWHRNKYDIVTYGVTMSLNFALGYFGSRYIYKLGYEHGKTDGINWFLEDGTPIEWEHVKKEG